jgi:membrane protein
MKRLENIVLRWPPVRWLVQKSKRCRPRGFSGLPLYDVVMFFIDQAKNIGFSTR